MGVDVRQHDADLGYTNDPTELVIFQEVPDPEHAQLRLVLRIHAEHVAYPLLSMILGLLERAYTPTGVGLDNGGNGMAVVQELLTLDAYKAHEFQGRLKGFDFGGVTALPLPDGQEIKKRTKELMTSLINGMLQRRQLCFPVDDQELEDQFTTHTYTLANGLVVYSKGNDHLIDAVRCAVLAREIFTSPLRSEEVVSLQPLVTKAIFV